MAEKIPFTDESPTAHIKVANVKFQFSTIAVPQIVKVIKKLINNKETGIYDIPKKFLKTMLVYHHHILKRFSTSLYQDRCLSKCI